MLSDEHIQKLRKSKDPATLKLLYEYLSNPLWSFRPRPDRPELLDEQTSYLNTDFQGLAVCLGGNRSGKSELSAVKTAKFLLETPPPRPNTPFWVVGRTLDMATAVCWAEKLSKYIPKDYIQAFTWYKFKEGLPFTVILKKHSNGNNWMIEFKSSEQEREKFQAASIGGAWLDEFCPSNIIVEIWARMSDYVFPGKNRFFYSLTPLTYDAELENKFNNQERYKDSWKFYRLNSALNERLAAGQLDMLIENEIEELRETRLTGAFVHLFGAVYKSFNPAVHVCEPFPIPDHWYKIRGLDLGFNNATCCLWIAKDDADCYYVYHEYFAPGEYIEDHVNAINEIPWRYDLGHIFGPTYVDPQNKQVVAEFQKLGIQTYPADRKDVKVGISSISRLLKPESGKPKLKIFKHCENLITGMRLYQWHPVLDKPIKENDDAVDALRYAIHTDQNAIKVIKPLILPDRNGIKVKF